MGDLGLDRISKDEEAKKALAGRCRQKPQQEQGYWDVRVGPSNTEARALGRHTIILTRTSGVGEEWQEIGLGKHTEARPWRSLGPTEAELLIF